MNWLTQLLALLSGGRSVAPAAPPVQLDSAPAAAAVPVLAVGDRPPLELLLRAAGFRDAEGWATLLAMPMRRCAIDTPRRIASFLGSCAQETGGGARLVESLDYSREGLRATFGARATPAALDLCRAPGRPANQAALANLLYGGEWGRRNLGNTDPGDGWRFRGRGLIQVTGRANYGRVADLLDQGLGPMMAAMETRAGAAETAASWWMMAGINQIADAGDIERVRRAVNGGLVGLPEVRRRYVDVLAAIGAQ